MVSQAFIAVLLSHSFSYSALRLVANASAADVLLVTRPFMKQAALEYVGWALRRSKRLSWVGFSLQPNAQHGKTKLATSPKLLPRRTVSVLCARLFLFLSLGPLDMAILRREKAGSVTPTDCPTWEWGGAAADPPGGPKSARDSPLAGRQAGRARAAGRRRSGRGDAEPAACPTGAVPAELGAAPAWQRGGVLCPVLPLLVVPPSHGAASREASAGAEMPRRMEKFLQIAPHSLAIVLSPCGGNAATARPVRQRRELQEGDDGQQQEEKDGGEGEAWRARAAGEPPGSELGRHHVGYEIFADFKQENMQHFWNKKVTAAVAETFFLGWIDEQVLLIQGKEEHLEVLREGWTRRSLKPPAGFQIKCLGKSVVALERRRGKPGQDSPHSCGPLWTGAGRRVFAPARCGARGCRHPPWQPERRLPE